MKATIILGSILLLTAGLAWAGEPDATTEVVDPARVAEVAEVGETTCDAAQPLPQDELALTGWAEQHGFEQVIPIEAATAALACPATISCNATHCIQTTFCATRDTGSSSCCIGFSCLLCPAGQTIHVQKCRCAGGGCVNANSQSFFCA